MRLLLSSLRFIGILPKSAHFIFIKSVIKWIMSLSFNVRSLSFSNHDGIDCCFLSKEWMTGRKRLHWVSKYSSDWKCISLLLTLWIGIKGGRNVMGRNSDERKNFVKQRVREKREKSSFFFWSNFHPRLRLLLYFLFWIEVLLVHLRFHFTNTVRPFNSLSSFSLQQ